MSIKVLQDARKHPAREASLQSITCVMNGDREGWLALWDENGIIEDPVGESPLDPEGKGHRGIEAITAFYDNVIAASGQTRFTIRHTYAAGNECANVGTITVKSPDGTVSRTELVMVYKVNAEGKVLSLRAFWEFEDTVASMF